MRHHDILPGHDYCLILDKLETNLPPWKRIYVEDADACSHVSVKTAFWTCRFRSTARQNLAFCILGRRKKFICGIGTALQCNQSAEKLNMVKGLTRSV